MDEEKSQQDYFEEIDQPTQGMEFFSIGIICFPAPETDGVAYKMGQKKKGKQETACRHKAFFTNR
jgi:hypothetical protein